MPEETARAVVERLVADDDVRAVMEPKLARAAAEVIEELGLDTVLRLLPRRWRMTPPAVGEAVLACRCGRSIDMAEMRRQPPRPHQSELVIQPIICPGCAA